MNILYSKLVCYSFLLKNVMNIYIYSNEGINNSGNNKELKL